MDYKKWFVLNQRYNYNGQQQQLHQQIATTKDMGLKQRPYNAELLSDKQYSISAVAKRSTSRADSQLQMQINTSSDNCQELQLQTQFRNEYWVVMIFFGFFMLIAISKETSLGFMGIIVQLWVFTQLFMFYNYRRQEKKLIAAVVKHLNLIAKQQ